MLMVLELIFFVGSIPQLLFQVVAYLGNSDSSKRPVDPVIGYGQVPMRAFGW